MAADKFQQFLDAGQEMAEVVNRALSAIAPLDSDGELMTPIRREPTKREVAEAFLAYHVGGAS